MTVPDVLELSEQDVTFSDLAAQAVWADAAVWSLERCGRPTATVSGSPLTTRPDGSRHSVIGGRHLDGCDGGPHPVTSGLRRRLEEDVPAPSGGCGPSGPVRNASRRNPDDRCEPRTRRPQRRPAGLKWFLRA